MIKVAIVDDHKLFRQGLAVILATKEDIEVVGRFETAKSFINALADLDVDLVLLDIDMPELDGITASPIIKNVKPDIKVIILSMHLNSGKIQDAVSANVNGYLLKTSSDTEVVDAIRTVIVGKDYFSQEAHEELINSYKKNNGSSKTFELTPREREILKLVCYEYNSHEIAEALNISIHTADTHRKNLLSKTGCKNSVGLVKYAFDNKLI